MLIISHNFLYMPNGNDNQRLKVLLLKQMTLFRFNPFYVYCPSNLYLKLKNLSVNSPALMTPQTNLPSINGTAVVS